MNRISRLKIENQMLNKMNSLKPEQMKNLNLPVSNRIRQIKKMILSSLEKQHLLSRYLKWVLLLQYKKLYPQGTGFPAGVQDDAPVPVFP